MKKSNTAILIIILLAACMLAAGCSEKQQASPKKVAAQSTQDTSAKYVVDDSDEVKAEEPEQPSSTEVVVEQSTSEQESSDTSSSDETSTTSEETASSESSSLSSTPPEDAVRLIFIHHSTGENWLKDEYGGLGKALRDSNYYVSDTNYGWGPESIGDRTDITDWTDWFRGSRSSKYLAAVYSEEGQNSEYTRILNAPSGENEIVMFKSCFPNSQLEGEPDDAPAQGEGLTVGNAKFIYLDLLKYFETKPDKLFIIVTAPPLSDDTYAANARSFNEWMANDLLDGYKLHNVAVFDFYNILTGTGNHHRYVNGAIEHATTGGNTLAYPSDDDHPSDKGSQKATKEFIPWLNVMYNCWKGNGGCL